MKQCSGYVQKQRALWAAVAAGAALLAIFLAAVLCYPVPWQMMRDDAKSDFSSLTVIDLNSADEEQLCLLPGIGPKKAAAIIAYRETYGGFLTLEEVLEIPGIGEGTLASWQGMAVVR